MLDCRTASGERGLWCVGTPDDLIAMIRKLQVRSGGFGGLLVQAAEWASREQVLHSYELLARYVMPEFQGSLVGLRASQADAERDAAPRRALQEEARARREYAEHREAGAR